MCKLFFCYWSTWKHTTLISFLLQFHFQFPWTLSISFIYKTKQLDKKVKFINDTHPVKINYNIPRRARICGRWHQVTLVYKKNLYQKNKVSSCMYIVLIFHHNHKLSLLCIGEHKTPNFQKWGPKIFLPNDHKQL